MPVLEKSADLRTPIDTSKPPSCFSRSIGGNDESSCPPNGHDGGGSGGPKNYVTIEDFALTFYLSGFEAASQGLLKEEYAGMFDGYSYDQFCRCLYVTLYAGDKANYWADFGQENSDNAKAIFVHFPTAKPIMVDTLLRFTNSGEPFDLVSAEIEKQILWMDDRKNAAELKRKGFSPLHELTKDPSSWVYAIFQRDIQFNLPRKKPRSDIPNISKEDKSAPVQEKRKNRYYSNGFIGGMAIVAASLLSYSCDGPPTKFMITALATMGLFTALVCKNRPRSHHAKAENLGGPPQ